MKTITSRKRIRSYALKMAQEWSAKVMLNGIDPAPRFTRFSPSFFEAVEEATKRAVAQIVMSNDQQKQKRKTLR